MIFIDLWIDQTCSSSSSVTNVSLCSFCFLAFCRKYSPKAAPTKMATITTIITTEYHFNPPASLLSKLIPTCRVTFPN